MKTNFVSISNIVKDWAEDNGIEYDEINEPLIIKWGIDALNMMNLMEQLKHKVILLQVTNSRAELPNDFKTLLNAAASVKKTNYKKTKREQVVQWIQGNYGDCHLEINLKCDKCHKSEAKCDCESKFKGPVGYEVDVDRIWEAAHPEYYYKGYSRIGRFGYGDLGEEGGKPKFELMRVATQDFHKVDLIIGDCPNLTCKDCPNTFRIEPPYFEVDFQEGELLLSYLGRVLDENGDPMVPDHPDVLEAIQNHIEYKYYGRKWKKENDQNAKRKSDDALALREVNIGIAKSVLDAPEYTEFMAWFNTQFYKRLPTLNRSANVNKHTRDKYDILGDMLKY